MKKSKIITAAAVILLALALSSCAETPLPSDELPHEELVVPGVAGADEYEEIEFNEADYTASRGLEFDLSEDESYYSVSGIGSCKDKIPVIPSVYRNLPVKAVKDRAFKDESITAVVLPDSVAIIGDMAFYNCNRLSSIVGGRGIKSIGEEAFSGTVLTEFNIGSETIDIHSSAFVNCFSILAFKVSPENAIFKAVDGNLYSKDGLNFLKYAAGKPEGSFTVPEGVYSIGTQAFAVNYKLGEVKLPQTLSRIEAGAFHYCISLGTVNIPDSTEFIGDSAFLQCSGLTEVSLGNGVKEIGDAAFAKCGMLSSVKMANAVERIGNYAFSGCYRLASLNLSENIVSIGAYSFENCFSIRSVTLGKNTEKIGSYAFVGCLRLESAELVGVKEIGYRAFYNCSNLSSVTLGSSLREIKEYAFCHTAIETLIIPEGLVSIGDSAFSGCESLTELVIPDTVEKIGTYAFCSCAALERLTLGKGLAEIGSSAFSECESLSEIAFTSDKEAFSKIKIGGYNSVISEEKIKFEENN